MPFNERVGGKVQKTQKKKWTQRHAFIAIPVVLSIVGFILFGLTARTGVAQSTNYEVTGAIGAYDTVFNVVYGVKENDPVFVSISPSSGDEWYHSYVYYPNQTMIKETYASGSHAYNFIAEVSGNYSLSFKTGSGYGAGSGFNYTIKSSHSLTPDGDFSLTASPDTLTVIPGTSEIITIIIESQAGYTSDISLSVSNVPIGVTTNFNPALVTLPSNAQTNSTVTISAGLTAQNGTTILQFTGTSGNLSNSCKVSLIVVVQRTPENTRDPISLPLPPAEAVAVATGITTAAGIGFRIGLPQLFQQFINRFAGKKWEEVSKKEMDELRKESAITKKELGHIIVSVLIMTFVFGVISANGLFRILDPIVLLAVLPSALLFAFLSTCMLKIVEIVSEIVSAKSCGVYRRFSLWRLGFGTFLVSGLVFSLAFSSPGITRYKREKQKDKSEKAEDTSKKTNGLMSLSERLVILVLAAIFAGFVMVGFPVIGDTGLLVTLMTVCFSLVPMEPFAGKAIFEYNKWIGGGALAVLSALLYGYISYFFDVWIYVVVGVVSLFLAVMTLIKLRKTVRESGC